MLRPTTAEAAAILGVFACICYYVRDRKVNSSAKFMLFSCIQAVKSILFSLKYGGLQDPTIRLKGESMQLCMMPVFMHDFTV